MTVTALPSLSHTPIDEQARALSQIQQMHAEVQHLREANDQLRADLKREKDRVIMMVEQFDRARHESVRFRKLALTLAVKMVNAALILEEAKDTIREMDEIDEAQTPPSEAIDVLEQQFKSGAAE